MSAASAVLTSPSVERVRRALLEAGLAGDIVELPGAARTAKAAADYLGCTLSQIANSLVFRAQQSERPVLVMSSGARRVDIERLARCVGEPVAKADADFVRRHTGFVIGGVAPVGHGLNTVYVERSLAQNEALWAAAGHPNTVFRLTYRELLRITGAPEVELAQ